MPPLTYSDAGVDIEAGDRLVDAIKPAARRTHRPEVLGGLGGFGGLFALGQGRWKDPVLVAGTDGVGTKLHLAFETGRHRTVGVDLVAMCVNDVVVAGAEPLFFLDYFATGHLEVAQGKDVVEGIADGCLQAGCALLGGETAEMPGFYKPSEYDLAGFAVGIAERDRLLDGSGVVAGDVLVGLASSGLHSNGYSLVRRALEILGHALDATPPELEGQSLGDVLMTPTRIYVKPLLALLEAEPVHALAHITGGGLPGNLPRVLPEDLAVRLDPTTWTRPAVVDLLAQAEIPEAELWRTFNMGLGMVAVVPRARAEATLDLLRAAGETAAVVGEVVPREDGPAVRIDGVDLEGN